MRAEARHQLKQDRFSRATMHAAEQTVHWTVEHQGKLIIAGIVVAIVAAAIVGAWYYNERQDERASVDFGKALQTFDMPVRPAGMPAQPDAPSFASAKERSTEAHKQFQDLVSKYPHTHVADFSHYFLGVTSAQLGDNAAAERELKAVADYHNRDLSALAKLALAGIYRDTNRTSDAVSLYKQLMERPSQTVSKSAAEFQLAETYQGAGMTADAKKQYQQIQKEAPAQSEANQLASAKLQELK
ncbi:MAG: tetratricopeptide repeat protein [Terriglobales bacterium]